MAFHYSKRDFHHSIKAGRSHGSTDRKSNVQITKFHQTQFNTPTRVRHLVINNFS